jgi:hypothetical protein
MSQLIRELIFLSAPMESIFSTLKKEPFSRREYPNEYQAPRMGVINDFHANSLPEKVVLLNFFKGPPH